MKKIIILLVTAFFAINANAQTELKKDSQVVMTADSLINNYLTLITTNDVQLSSFEVSALVDEYSMSIKNNTGELSPKQISIIKRATPGSKVIFEKIKTKDNTGKEVEIKDVVVVIK